MQLIFYTLLKKAYIAEVACRGCHYNDDNFTIERLKKIAFWLTNAERKCSLLLYGDQPGTGKTTSARAIWRLSKALKESYSRDSLCRMQSARNQYFGDDVRDYFDAMHDAIRTPSYYTATNLANIASGDKCQFDAITTCSYMIIDELGVEPCSVKFYGTTVLPLAELLCKRYEKIMPTIITTNLSLQGISDIYGARVADRLREMCEFVAYTGHDSYRQ